jgi:large subunit ribosomal protein L1
MKLLNAFGPSAANAKSIPYISLSLKLDVHVKRQSVRGVCQLPHGLRSNTKLLVFCSDFDAQEMLDAGADFAGMNELLQRIGKGWTGFDRCIATPAVMPQVMKVAKILGPKKLMPNPKSGTLVTDLKRAILESKSGAQLEYRTRETEPVVDVIVGSLDVPLQHNLDNIKFVVREVLKHKGRQSGGAGDEGNGVGRLVTTGGISMLPNVAKLNRLLNEKTKTETGNSGGRKKSLFIQEAFVKSGDDVVVELEPEMVLPSSPAYYR